MYIDKYEIKLHGNMSLDKPLIYLIGDEMVNNLDMTVISVSGIDWNKDLSPWPCPAVFKNGEDFKGKANDFLNVLVNKIIPLVEQGQDHKRYLIGYSLAGLFSLYALLNSDVFDGSASVSGSLWYPDFKDYVLKQDIEQNKRIYLSLGDKEAKSKNPILKTVKDNTEDIYHYLKEKCDCYYELNPGNHFQDADKRIKKAINFLIK